MEKLIELLNEYEKSGLNEFELEKYEEWWYCKWNGKILTGNWENNNELTPYELYSKQFGFIKWLVENDKIETNNLSLKAFKNIFSGGGFVEVSDLEVLLMLLAISSSPIEDLILYLK